MTWRSLAVLALAGLIMTVWRYPATAIVENFGIVGVVVTLAGLVAVAFWMERKGY